MEVISIKDHWNKNTANITKTQTLEKKMLSAVTIAGEISIMEFNTYFRIGEKKSELEASI